MDHFAGLDVSVKETSVCIVDDTGRIVREVKVASAAHAGGVAHRHQLHELGRPTWLCRNRFVVTVRMGSSSESWEPQQPPYPWRSRAGGGAVHSINNS